MRGFVSTLPRLSGRSNTAAGRVFALDCEMCYTTQGNELTRVTVIDQAGEVIYESLVKPDNEIVDYNTRSVQYNINFSCKLYHWLVLSSLNFRAKGFSVFYKDSNQKIYLFLGLVE